MSQLEPAPPHARAALRVEPIPAFEDNYLWLIHDGCDAVVVDPGDAVPVESALSRLALRLQAILVTHSHADHIGGIPALLTRRDIPVYGPAREPVPGRTHAVGEGSRVALRAPAIDFKVLDVPGHTVGHVAYYGQNLLFCGDTLFACGCGRIDQPAALMHASLMRLAALPPKTLVYCTHEYTQANIRFALTVDPDNLALRERAARVSRQRAAGEPTLPSSIGDELSTNPFLRCNIAFRQGIATLAAGSQSGSASETFARLRKLKDEFRPDPA